MVRSLSTTLTGSQAALQIIQYTGSSSTNQAPDQQRWHRYLSATMMKSNKDECKALDSHLKARCPRTCGWTEIQGLKNSASFLSYIKLVGTARVMWLPGNLLAGDTINESKWSITSEDGMCTYSEGIRRQRHLKSYTDKPRAGARVHHCSEPWRAKVPHDYESWGHLPTQRLAAWNLRIPNSVHTALHPCWWQKLTHKLSRLNDS